MDNESVLRALRQVMDPELGINIVDLGLVYRVVVDRARVEVVMTMTSPACPLGGELSSEAEAAVRKSAPEPCDVEVRLVLYPPWNPSLMTADAKRQLGWAE